MRVLVVGGGAREHAITWKLAQSPRRPELFVAPGNPGTAELGTNLPVAAEDIGGMIAAARLHDIDLTVIGPEAPLVAGMADAFHREGLRVFGPTSAAARIEGSKSFAKQVMRDAGVPTAAYRVFDDPSQAANYVHERGAPLVVKVDGLAAGKGVVVGDGRGTGVAGREQRDGPAGVRERRRNRRYRGMRHRPGGERVLLHRRGRRHAPRCRMRLQAHPRRRSRAEHRRHGRLQPASVVGRSAGTPDSRDVHRAGRGAVGQGGRTVQRRALRGRLPHRPRPHGVRVQRAARRSRSRAHPAPSRIGPPRRYRRDDRRRNRLARVEVVQQRYRWSGDGVGGLSRLLPDRQADRRSRLPTRRYIGLPCRHGRGEGRVGRRRAQGRHRRRAGADARGARSDYRRGAGSGPTTPWTWSASTGRSTGATSQQTWRNSAASRGERRQQVLRYHAHLLVVPSRPPL